MKNKLVFNRVQGLKFLYDNFPYYYDESRINLFFVNSKKELLNLHISNHYDTIVLKRSANKQFINDIKFKDNRFFKSFDELKDGINEFTDMFDYCVECHNFKNGDNYYSDRLAIAQFSTRLLTDTNDKVSFIPAYVSGVNTRENSSYLEIEYPNNYSSIYHINKCISTTILHNKFDYTDISYLATQIHSMIDNIRDYLIDINCHNDFQLIIRIDSYLNLLPIDFRTSEAWARV